MIKILVIISLLILFFCLAYWRSPYQIVKHCDGDTSYVKPLFGRQKKIRYAVIDANESRQAGGKEATEYLYKILPIGSRVSVVITGKKSYDRDFICTVYHGFTDINLAMLKAGHAMIDTRYLHTIPPSMQAKYIRAEVRAKAKRLGRWKSQKTSVAPWDFRKVNKHN